MTDRQPNLFTRSDTFFGVCEGLGEDLGISPLILRLALALVLFFSVKLAVAIYLGAGALVLATRLLIPNRAAAAVVAPAAAEPLLGDNDAVPLAQAA